MKSIFIFSDILPDSVLKFEFDKPDEPSGEQRSYEIASRMLFLTARWIRNFCNVHSISVELQIKFMLHTWSDLFLIGISQCCTKDDLKYIFETVRYSQLFLLILYNRGMNIVFFENILKNSKKIPTSWGLN